MVKANLKYDVGDNIRHEVTKEDGHHTFIGTVENLNGDDIIIKVKEYGINGKKQLVKPKRISIKQK